MIPTLDTNVIDLGRDRERIGGSDAARQTSTVNHVLRAFFGPLSERREIQLLADEVGMGKTYVALAAAYAILSILRDTTRSQELKELADCYRCVLVITPGGNPTLANKWDREDEALLTRCARDPAQAGWFQSVLCESADQLLQNILRADDRRRRAPVIMVAQSSVFTKRLSDAATRFVTACLFRWWGQGLPMRERYHIVRGLSETVGSGAWGDAAAWAGRGEYDIQLWDWSRHERFLAATDQERKDWQPRWEWRLFTDVSVVYTDMQQALDRFDQDGGAEGLENLRRLCRGVPTRRPGDRRTAGYSDWLKWFRKLKDEFRDVFKRLWPYLLRKRFPLVITDEAHHWRNNHTGDFKSIREFIAPHTKRMLLLTATPFQLNPQETVNVLNVIDHMEQAIGANRVAELQEKRDRLAKCMEASAIAGQAFSREWGALSDQMARWDPTRFDVATTAHGTDDERLNAIAEIWGQLSGAASRGQSLTLEQVPGPLRPFFKRATDLRAANEDLERAMRPLVVRHRRSTHHRRYLVGREYPPTMPNGNRPDQDRLHLAPGQALEPRDELVQYLLMKVVAVASQGRHRTALGTAITGCYSTMWQSQEGRKAIEAAAASDQRGLLRALQRMTGVGGKARDEEHPKLRRVVDAVLQRWDRGDKSLIFCFRVPTATALHRTLSRRIEDHLRKKRTALLRARGTEVESDEDRDKAMQAFRRSLTAREGSGVPLFVDRVLIGWFLRLGWPVPIISDDDLQGLANVAARARVAGRVLFPSFERPDRVFLQRAVEHVWARRLLRSVGELPASDEARGLTISVLQQMADERWVCDRYGQRELSTGKDRDDVDLTERAVRSSLAAHYDLGDAEPSHVGQLLEELRSRQQSGRETILDTLVTGPNLLGAHGPAVDGLTDADRDLVAQLRDAMFALTLRKEADGEQGVGGWNWESRSTAIDAITRALLRDDILLRMPASVFSGHDETWAARLFHGFHQPMSASHTGETLAQRVLAFLLELGRMSSKERNDYLEYAMNPKAEAVALVQGGTSAESRNAIFCGFNTPLLPEILVCTAVGQEGIDLHRECSHVIHYDLGWNPATIEQRTGRTDRIGSKTERERRLAASRQISMPGLDVALPYLAATYDERMFDALRTRAQVFEILTGGDPTADRDGDGRWLNEDDEGEDLGTAFVPLPQNMLDDLKVDLAVSVE